MMRYHFNGYQCNRKREGLGPFKGFKFCGIYLRVYSGANSKEAATELHEYLDEHIDFNVTKLSVGVLNELNAYRNGMMARVAGMTSTITFALGQPQFGVPLAGYSAWKAGSATKASIRAAQQIGEAFAEDFNDSSFRNLLGLGPYGQHFDDPHEPTPQEFMRNKDFELSDVFEMGSVLP